MAEVIRMPKMSDTMEEGVIATWLKKEGDAVKAGDILAEIETDKATMELEAYEDGTLLYIGVKAKEAAPINGVIAILGEKGEDIASLLEEAKQLPNQKAAKASAPLPTTPAPKSAPNSILEPASIATPAEATTQRIFASPLAKKIAQEKGYDLATVEGTGERGRIIKRDIEGFIPTGVACPQPPSSANTTPIVGEESYEDLSVSQMRKTIAKRLAESKFSAPHFYLTIQVAMDQLVAARSNINEYASIKITFNDFIIKAAALAIKQHPAVNVAWLGNMMRYNKHIHIGVAIAVEEGLLVPVIRFADSKSLLHLATEVKTLSQKAHDKQLQPQDWEGSTFTISNLGMLGIEAFTAIINPPAACILAIGEIKQVPVVKQGAVAPGYVMKATLSCDHRAVDGAMGASFLKTFKALLEDPMKMLVY